MLGLPYPGGLNLDKAAKNGNPSAYKMPHPHVEGAPFDFSFSGLKTFVINTVHTCEQKGETVSVEDMGASVINAVVTCLVGNTEKAALELGYDKIVLAGGVSANSVLRERMTSCCASHGWQLFMPSLDLCGDNAAMVGAQGYYEYIAGHTAGLDLNARATMPIEEEF